MLSYLKINNVALIDSLTIDFEGGFNVLTGETGAGKSIIVDSLNFVLGGKVNKNLIRAGQSQMRVEAMFCAPFDNKIKPIFEEYGIELDDEILITRTYTENGKSDVRVNGAAITATMLKPITSGLVDILGQHEHQSVLKEKFQLEIIDILGGAAIETLRNNVFDLYHKLNNINKEIDSLGSSSQNRERMIDLLNYQITEIENFGLKENEEEELESERLKSLNSEKISTGLNMAYTELNYSNYSVCDGIKKAISALNSIVKYDEKLDPIISRLDSAKLELQDISETLQDYASDCNFDENYFDKIDKRLDELKMLKKKYGASYADIMDFLDKAKIELDNIINSEERLNSLNALKNEVIKELYNDSVSLSNNRKLTAKKFEFLVKSQLEDLGMKNANFEISFAPIEEIGECNFAADGLDKVKYLFTANIGQPLKPLSDIISGGEMSRFMLGLKNILADIDSINTMVFDEIDTGISGNIGYVIACKMANISKEHQVIAISHLPQIAAMADKNFLIEKVVVDGNTKTNITALDEIGVLNEVARLSGGQNGSLISLDHAKELRITCSQYKKGI